METLSLLRQLNSYDLQLYEYAVTLVQTRMKELESRSKSGSVWPLPESSKSNTDKLCDNKIPRYASQEYRYSPRNRQLEQKVLHGDKNLAKPFRHQMGLFQPPGHKGPL